MCGAAVAHGDLCGRADYVFCNHKGLSAAFCCRRIGVGGDDAVATVADSLTGNKFSARHILDPLGALDCAVVGICYGLFTNIFLGLKHDAVVMVVEPFIHIAVDSHQIRYLKVNAFVFAKIGSIDINIRLRQ